jgi:hypothetical protein
VASPFPLSVQYGETDVQQNELLAHDIPGFRKLAKVFAHRALSAPSQMVGFVDISGVELADASLRFSEDYCPAPDWSLDAYWAAMRGVPTVFPLLVFSMTPTEYAKMISLPAIGEATAGYILEEPSLHPSQLNLHALCRPLHSAPDLLMCYRAQTGRLALVEVKASESKTATEAAVDALSGALPVLTAWRNTGNAIDAIGVGVSVDGKSSSAGPILNVVVVKLVDRQGSNAAPYAGVGATAIDALWAGDIEEGVTSLDVLQEALTRSHAPPDQVSMVRRMRGDAHSRREMTGFKEEYLDRRVGELIVSDRVEVRSYPRQYSVRDLTSIAQHLQQASFRVIQTRRRSLDLLVEGLEINIFWDGRIRIIGRYDQKDLAKSVAKSVIQKVEEIVPNRNDRSRQKPI